ncbi:MAG: hypothetical protein QM499_04590 [Flavobacteriaceae bacterium]
MKNILYVSVTVLLFFSCSKDNSNEEDSTIFGKWQLVEYCGSDGASWFCSDIVDGYKVSFNEDGTFSFSEGITGCLIGTYTYNNEKITLQYESNACSGTEGVFIYNYSFIDNSLKLTASGENITCIEGCEERFNKISN